MNRKNRWQTAGLAGVGVVAAAALAARWITRSRRRISFEGRTVLITGGSRGLGMALAREFAKEGARLALIARDKTELERAAADVQSFGSQVLAVPANITSPDQAEAAVKQVIEQLGSIDVLVNNAGIISVGPLEEMDESDYEEALAIHTWAPLYMMQAVVSHMKSTGKKTGRIVNVASIGAKIAMPHMAPYTVSKFALAGLSDAFRNELAKDGICVTTVFPGMMRTGSHINAMFKGDRSHEFGWFSLGGATPLTSIAADKAARQIVEACRYGQPPLIITWQARLATLAAALFPATTARILASATRVLPRPTLRHEPSQPGWQCRNSFPPKFVTSAEDRASEELNELIAQGPPP